MLRGAPLLVLAVCLCALIGPSPAAAAEAPEGLGNPAYAAELVAAARALHLADARYWHVLLHDHPRLFGGLESEVDGADFFLSPRGKRDPEAELEATLAAFFAPVPADPNVQHAQCRFIARYTWLDGQLHFDPARLPPQPCRRFHQWFASIRPDTLVLVFPSAYLNSPPSMFGHTLFRLDRKDRPELLDYALNYAAQVPDDPGAFYALKGLLGFYPGQFTIVPYYAKVQTYGEIENRDLWEYRLNLTPDEVTRMLMHAWELGPTYFDYFFLKENCSYHLLSLLEAARPELHLTDRFHGWTIPTDTLRAVTSYPGLVGEVTFRPSRASVIRYREGNLPPAQVRLARRVADGAAAPDGPPLETLAPATRGRVLDLSYDYLLFREAEHVKPEPAVAARESAVLLARSRVDAPPAEDRVPAPATPPHLGHGTERATLGAGGRDGAPFVQLGYRTAYHDLLDPDPGYDPDGQVQVLGGEVRAYTDTGRVELSRLTVLDIFSLAPREGVFREKSWKVRAEWQARRTGDCTGCGAFDLDAGPGLAVRGPFGRTVFYTFLDLDAAYGRRFARDYVVGAGLDAGAVVTLSRRVKATASAGWVRYGLGDVFNERRFAVAGRVSLGRDAALRLTVSGARSPFRSTSEGIGEVDVYW
jgi:hypothetical protein